MEAETLIKKEMLNQELIESERLERECIGAEKQSGLNGATLSCSKRTKSGRETRVRAPKSRDRDIRRGGNNRRRETADERLI
mmetsp:Transcript_2532/g.5822  ORF Transcript_2532/g.5822 Transcript_2532/m.5822 type:complete len:82 (-) Transcript_2532:320-565(-)